MEIISSVLSIVQKFFYAGGGIVAIYNLALFGINLKESNGPEMRNSLLGAIGGGVLIACGYLMNSLDINFYG